MPPRQFDVYQLRMSITGNVRKKAKTKALSSAVASATLFVELPQHLRCPSCENILFNAFMSPHGCRLCESCVTNKVSLTGQSRCPSKNEECRNHMVSVDASDGANSKRLLRVDNSTRRDLSELQVYCINTGCGKIMKWVDLEQHISSCDFPSTTDEDVVCGSGIAQKQSFSRSDVTAPMKVSALPGVDQRGHEHFKSNPNTCPFCAIVITADNVNAHFSLFSSGNPDAFCNKLALYFHSSRNHIPSFNETLQLSYVMPCPFKGLGCGDKFEKLFEFRRHMEDNVVYHSLLSAQEYDKFASKNINKGLDDDSYKKQMMQVTDQFSRLQHNLAVKFSVTASTDDSDRAASIGNEGARRKDSQRGSGVDGAVAKEAETPVVRRKASQGGSSVDGAVAKEEETPAVVTEQLELVDGSVTEQLQLADGSNLNNTISQLVSQLVEARGEISMLTESVKLLQEDAETSYSGTLIWRVYDFDRKLRESREEFSKPFYSYRYGYKMCGRIYPNGDGTGKGKFVSVYFLIMKGEYDDVLEWPFRRHVKVRLLDQSGSQKHVSDSFRTIDAVGVESYTKPVNEMNTPAGFPKFVSHDKLKVDNRFVKDGAVLIQMMV